MTCDNGGDSRPFPLSGSNLNLCGIERYSTVHSNKGPVSPSLIKPFPLPTFLMSLQGWLKPFLSSSLDRIETKHRTGKKWGKKLENMGAQRRAQRKTRNSEENGQAQVPSQVSKSLLRCFVFANKIKPLTP